MKVSLQTNEKPKYQPITIILETAGEYFSVLAALGTGKRTDEIKMMESLGVVLTTNGVFPSEGLYEMLEVHKDKVKETL